MPDSFDHIAIFYNWIEQRLLRDHQGSIDIIEQYLHLNESDSIIDLGGGTGFIAQFLSSKAKQVIVIDPSMNSLKKNNDSSIQNIRGNAMKIPFKEQTVDIVILVSVVHHIPYNLHEHVFQESKRILKEKGVLFIIEALPATKIVHKIFVNIEQLFVGKTYHLLPDQLKMELQKQGFHHVELYFPKDHDWKYAIKATS